MQPQVGVVGVGGHVVERADDRADRDGLGVAVVVASDQRGQLRRHIGQGEARRRAGARFGQFRCGKPGVEYRSVGGQGRQPDACSSSHGRHGTSRAPTTTPWGRAGLARAIPIELTAALVDIPSESRDEARIADEVEAALRAQTSGFEIIRNGNAVLARTQRSRPSRVLLAGHLDTVPAAGNLPSRRRPTGDAARLRHLRHEIR